jgi:hypothetical protein
MTRWKEQWKIFAARAPGARFRERYERHRASLEARAWWLGPCNIIVGVLSLLLGLVLTVAPGPAVVFLLFGGLLLGNESRRVAGVLDWIDVRIAPWLVFLHRHWLRLSPWTRRVLVVGLTLGGLASFIASLLLLR